MHQKTTMGLAIIAGGLAFVGSANATDLIINGSFEEPNNGEWIGSFGTYKFTDVYFAGPAIPESYEPGINYSWRHREANNDVPLTQLVDLTAALSPTEIDAGDGKFALSAWLASYTSNPEVAKLSVDFFSPDNTALGHAEFSGASSTYLVRNADGSGPEGWTTKNWSLYLREGQIPAGARSAVVSITRDPAAGLSGNPDTYVDLVKLDVFASAAPVPPTVESIQPAAGSKSVPPTVVLDFTIRDGTTQVKSDSIQFQFDGATTAPTVTKEADVTRVKFDPPGLLPANSTHTALLTFSDNANPANTKTVELSFTVLPYLSFDLPTPLVFENFDGIGEGELPAGWTIGNFIAPPNEDLDLGDLNSKSYADWVVVQSDRFKESLLTYDNHAPSTDYRRVLSPNPQVVLNGELVENYAQGNILFGDSGYRSGSGQYLYTVTPDFDFSGKSSLYLIFKSLWEQNQDSIGTVEYSIDEGVTWIPLLYMLENADVKRDASGGIDALETFSAIQGDTARFTDLDGNEKGNRYGDFLSIPEDQWATLAPYISPRVNDDPAESKRLEILALPNAANQSKVRFRFGHAGTDSWYFGIDDVGVYSVTSWPAPQLEVVASAATTYVGNRERLSVNVKGVGPFTFQWKKNGVAVAGATADSLILADIQATDAGNYTVEVGYTGGTATSAPLALSVSAAPTKLLGQWDFQGDLKASYGRDLAYASAEVEPLTVFSTTEALGIPGIGERSVQVMGFNPVGKFDGYRLYPGLTRPASTSASGKLNQYTLILDVFYPSATSAAWRSLLQLDPTNADDGEFFINPSGGIGIDSVYNGVVSLDEWHRLAIAVDLVGPGVFPGATIFIDGQRVAKRSLSQGADARWSFPVGSGADDVFALLFADESGDVAPGYVSSAQLYEGRLSESLIASLGGASADKLPSQVIQTSWTGGKLTLSWPGAQTLESAPSLNGPWTTIQGAASPYEVTALPGAAHYFRLKTQ
ncbi:MAG: hypothetical protein JNN07_08030 [Verrucomicrobiales bacterium]|nr:hypothetical protein [Verrucomicrobiales bacterium]